MRKLTVKNFSVIRNADFCLNRVNVIIGPQASGKSLLCKLSYFFLDILSSASDAAIEETSLKAFKQQVKESFLQWFPLNTWGKQKFEIEYRQGHFEASVLRTSYSGSVGETIRMTLCQSFCETYESAIAEIRSLNEHARSKQGNEGFRPWQAREAARKLFVSLLDAGESEFQTYIPAGRAFFTTYGKAITVVGSGSLDPINSRFGQMIDWMFNDQVYMPSEDRQSMRFFEDTQSRILKGNLRNKRGIPRFETEDGRNLSLAHLSSGTQEALPLLSALRMTFPGNIGRTIFAEEPEAHLFPSAQWELVKLFAWLANKRPRSCWVITTHSPYILSVFGELVKAGKVGGQSAGHQIAVAKVIPEHYWIKGGDFTACKIEDGTLTSIYDKESGQIDGDYLDSVSGKISEEFGELLEIQYGK